MGAACSSAAASSATAPAPADKAAQSQIKRISPLVVCKANLETGGGFGVQVTEVVGQVALCPDTLYQAISTTLSDLSPSGVAVRAHDGSFDAIRNISCTLNELMYLHPDCSDAIPRPQLSTISEHCSTSVVDCISAPNEQPSQVLLPTTSGTPPQLPPLAAQTSWSASPQEDLPRTSLPPIARAHSCTAATASASEALTVPPSVETSIATTAAYHAPITACHSVASTVSAFADNLPSCLSEAPACACKSLRALREPRNPYDDSGDIDSPKPVVHSNPSILASLPPPAFASGRPMGTGNINPCAGWEPSSAAADLTANIYDANRPLSPSTVTELSSSLPPALYNRKPQARLHAGGGKGHSPSASCDVVGDVAAASAEAACRAACLTTASQGDRLQAATEGEPACGGASRATSGRGTCRSASAENTDYDEDYPQSERENRPVGC